ncbi:MAG TPA: protein tyrosine phosphatase family protein [Trichocoleus sp.]
MPTAPLEAIYNFLTISDTLATAGQPTAAQFDAIREAGYTVVVNLALPTSSNALPNEQEIVESQGMMYVHIPVQWESPTLDDLQQFFAAMGSSSGNRVFVHCAANMRVSAFVYLYRLLRQGVAEEQARHDLNQIWQPNETWQRFIDQARSAAI